MNKLVSVVVIAVLLVLFVSLNIVGERALRGLRVDLTEEGLYSLSEAGRAIARSPDEPVRLTLYFSESVARGNPSLEGYGRRVQELLEAFERSSAGKIELTVIDPEPFSEAEDEAVSRGVGGLPISRDERFYFGLVGTNAVDGQEVIPFFNASDPQGERFLEYEIAKLIHRLAEPERPTVGLMTALPMTGTPPNQMTGQPGQPAWQIARQLRETFEVLPLDPFAGEIPESVDVLLVIHPESLPDETVYALDQHVLGGGRAVFFVDPVCLAATVMPDQRNPMSQFQGPTASDLPRLFDAWGIDLLDGVAAGDLERAVEIQVRSPRGGVDVLPYVVWLRLEEESLTEGDPATGRLDQIIVGTAGILERREDAPASWEPLIVTSDQAAPVDAERVGAFPDHRGVLNEFVVLPGQEPLVLAARVTGEVPSAFPEGAPAGDPDEATEEGEQAEDEDGSAGGRRAQGEINVVVVADVDLMQDQFWIREQRIGSLVLGYQQLSDNGALVLNLVEQMAGSTDLLALRARGDYRRPFTAIEELQRQADAELVAEETRLQEKIRSTEQRIQELQQARGASGEDASGRLVLTPEQRAEIDSLQEELVASRRTLRNVRFELNEDVEALKNRVKLIVIGAAPALLLVMAMTLGLYRGVRRRVDRRKGQG